MPRMLILDDVEGRHVVLAQRYAWCERVHVRTVDEALAAIAGERFDLASLDHDLGEERTGQHVAIAIAALPVERRTREAIIHSHNPVGAERMRDILEEAGIRCRIEPFSGLARRG